MDASGSERLKYDTRMLATRAYSYGGEPAKAFVTFSWCLAAHDRGEGVAAPAHSLFWHFKCDGQLADQVPGGAAGPDLRRAG